MLRNTMGVGVYGSAQISVTKVHGATLLALQGSWGCQMSRKKRYITLEWPFGAPLQNLGKFVYPTLPVSFGIDL